MISVPSLRFKETNLNVKIKFPEQDALDRDIPINFLIVNKDFCRLAYNPSIFEQAKYLE